MNRNQSISIDINNPEVAAVFKSYPKKIRAKLMFLRQLIFDTASVTDGVGEIEETLKEFKKDYVF